MPRFHPALALAGTLALGSPAAAAEPADAAASPFSGYITLASNYIFRGLSATSDNPQLIGNVTWAHPSGLYAGVWSSNTDVGGERNSMEIDPYVGFSSTVGNTGLVYDAGLWLYFLPGSRADLDGDGTLDDASFDYWELYTLLSYDFGPVTLGGSVWYADDYYGDDFFPDTAALAYDTTLTVPLPANLSLSGTVGRQTFDEPAGLAPQDYTYFDVGIRHIAEPFTFDLRWHDANGVRPELLPDQFVGGWVGSVTFSM